MIAASRTASVIEMTVPLPPKELRGNGRCHWSKLKKLKDDYSEQVHSGYLEAVYGSPFPRWPALKLKAVWYQCWPEPDADNCIRGCKVLCDVLAAAPATMAGKDRWYCGLVENDRDISWSLTVRRVAHKAEERLELRLVRKSRPNRALEAGHTR